MSTRTELRAPAGIGTSFRQQLLLITWSGRWAYMILGLLFLLVAIGTMEIDELFGLPRLVVAAMVGLFVPAMWALLLWYGEVPSRRSYHWSLPVARPAHDLMRIAVGALWLLVSYVALAGAGAIVAATSGEWTSFRTITGPAWMTFFTGPLVLYFALSPFALWSDSPTLRRVLAGFFLVGVLATLLDLEWYAYAMEYVFGDGWGLTTALVGGFRELADMERGPRAAEAMWLAMGIVATVLAATFRPAEIARLVRRR